MSSLANCLLVKRYSSLRADFYCAIISRMGIYLNPDNQNFSLQVNKSFYVDKTLLIDETNKRLDDPNFKFLCVSRPRRFGKSIAENMLVAYYSKGADSKALFEAFKISKTENFEKHLNKYNVVHIDLNAMYSDWLSATEDEKKGHSFVSFFTRIVCEEFKVAFPDVTFAETSLSSFILKVWASKKETFIVIIDEYDVLIREKIDEKELDIYRGFLTSLFKNAHIKPAISLAYLTGILPIMKDKVQSKLNEFSQINMLRIGKFAEYTGFTTEEVKTLCEKYGCDFEECKSWYDGYNLKGVEIYNPQAVINAVISGEFISYWSETSTYSVVAEKIRMNFAGTKEDVIAMMGGEKVSVNVNKYDNTMNDFNSKDDVFTFLIHLGYLAYDEKERKCYIPNKEIYEEWQKVIEDDENYAETNKIILASEQLLRDTIAGNENAVAEGLDNSHRHVTSWRNYNNEYALHSAIYLAYIYCLNGYTIAKEIPTGNGCADIMYIPFDKSKEVIIVELKFNGSASKAIEQIKSKKYFDLLDNRQCNILFVGVNYDQETRNHECKIERFQRSCVCLEN